MRLQLRVAALGLLVLTLFLFLVPSSVARAEHEVRARTDVYGDQWVLVISPAATGSFDLGERWNLAAGLGVDVLSGATPIFSTDVITAATRFSDARYGPHGSLTFSALPAWRISAGYSGSVESDHLAHAPGISTEIELLDRTATLMAAYTFVHEEVWRRHESSDRQTTGAHRLDLGWTHLLARRTVLLLLGTLDGSQCQARLGCDANPYRYVPVVNDSDAILAMATERHPENRIRGALAARLVQGLGKAFGLHVGYRFYVDTWRLQGHTGDVALAREFFRGRLLARLEGRVTYQGAAAFFRDDYRTAAPDPAIPRYRTGDPELARLVDVMPALRLRARFPALGPVQFGMSARVAYVYHRYLNMTDRPDRHAWLAGLGADATF